jgi:hypothetical protein
VVSFCKQAFSLVPQAWKCHPQVLPQCSFSANCTAFSTTSLGGADEVRQPDRLLLKGGGESRTISDPPGQAHAMGGVEGEGIAAGMTTSSQVIPRQLDAHDTGFGQDTCRNIVLQGRMEKGWQKMCSRNVEQPASWLMPWLDNILESPRGHHGKMAIAVPHVRLEWHSRSPRPAM